MARRLGQGTLPVVVNILIYKLNLGWRDSSVAKNTDCSCREPEFGSQHPCGSLKLPGVLVSEGSDTLSCLPRHQTLTWCIDRQTFRSTPIHTQILKSNLLKIRSIWTGIGRCPNPIVILKKPSEHYVQYAQIII